MKKPASFVILIFAALIFVTLLTPRVLKIEKLKERQANLELELEKLKRDNQQLTNELRLLKDDPVYLEKVAREKFNKAKEGEIVYKVVHEGQAKEGQ